MAVCKMGMLSAFAKRIAAHFRIVKRRGRGAVRALDEAPVVQTVETTHRVLSAVVDDLPTTETSLKRMRAVEPLERHHSIASSGVTLRFGFSTEEAFTMFVSSLETGLTVRQQRSRRRIQKAYALSQPGNIGQLVACRLEDIDNLLFRGALRKVPVEWQPLPPRCYGETTCPRVSKDSRKGSIKVGISESLIDNAAASRGLIWGTIVHELLHAYGLVMSRKLEDCLCGNKVAHGPGFRAVAMAAVKLLEIESLTFEKVADYTEGCCHSRHDDFLLRELEMKSTLTDEQQSSLLSCWKKEG